MHLCAELIAAFMTLEPLGEVGANFSLQLSSRTQFTKINNKKVISENQCEKHKKSSLVISMYWYASSWHQGYNRKFMLYSTEHETSTGH